VTRRDFELIAQVIREHDAFPNERARASFASGMAGALGATNPRFDRARFVAACRPSWVVGTRAEVHWDKAGAL
jgi:hypothetical protein